MPLLLPPRSRLILAWFCFLTHVLALGAMLLVIQPGLLVGTEVSRREFIAAHAIAWQIGWLLWMPASLGLVLLFLAWADTLEFKVWGMVAVGLCFAGGSGGSFANPIGPVLQAFNATIATQ